MSRRPRKPAPPPPTPKVERAAYTIPEGRERMDGACDSCGFRFEVDAEELRDCDELEVNCPQCKRKMLVQHVEYACVMIIE